VSLKDKLKNLTDKGRGKVKDVEGRATGDKSREAQGKTEQAVADFKQAGEKVKDAFNK
jgi:uncharacterized protein YjbJ (UPF0337 family)